MSMHGLPWDIEARRLPGKSPLFAGARTFRFHCAREGDQIRIAIPGNHRGPDNVDATFPAQERWMNTGARAELVRARWDCAWDAVDGDAFDAFVGLLGPHLTAKTAADQRTLDELRRSSSEEPENTIAEASRLLATSPTWGEVALIRGKARERNKDIEGARADYDRALEIYPDNVAALLAAGYLRISDEAQAAREEALALFTRALSLVPTDDSARYHYTRQLQRLGQTEEALRELDRGVPFMAAPEQAYLRGEWLHELGRDEEAIAVLEEAVKGAASIRAQALLDAIRGQHALS
ncbi:MAG: hypothetical protein DRJ42_07385 [Deltaproteobacteria bacterium]|nr:MAG: hypothetical protein DRJ42_07385 [Deltaproteobacteria bacterium]